MTWVKRERPVFRGGRPLTWASLTTDEKARLEARALATAGVCGEEVRETYATDIVASLGGEERP